MTLLCFACAVWLAGCSSVATQVLLEVDAEPMALAEATHVRVRRFTTEGIFEQQESLTGRASFPFMQPLQPDADDTIHVEVALLRDGAVLSEKVVRTRFVGGERRYVRVVFEENCRGVSCAGAQSCVSGVCAESCYDAAPEPPSEASIPIPCETCGTPQDESCDGIDNDCDGVFDEASADDPAPPTVCIGPGETTVFESFQNANEDYIRVSDVVVDAESSFAAFYAYLAPSRIPSAQFLRAVIYSDEGGPGMLVASGASVRVELSEAGWVRAPIDAELTPGRYWIGLHTGTFEGVLTYANSEAPETASAFLAIAAFADGVPERATWEPIVRKLSGFLERAP